MTTEQNNLAKLNAEKLDKLVAWVNSTPTDIWVFNSDIDVESVDQLILQIRMVPKVKRMQSVGLILTTNGGDPDAGYRLARFLKQTYAKVTIYVFGKCKSAGTLIALGASEIVMGDFGELGPLDVQLDKEDDFIHNISGLAYNEALGMIREQSFLIFDKLFLDIQVKSGGNITARTSAEIASKLATDLLAPITAQIDPIKLGEVGRAINISTRYGNRLTENSATVSNLTTQYPCHSFVIDREESIKLIGAAIVREPNESEILFEELFFNNLRYVSPERISIPINESTLKPNSTSSQGTTVEPVKGEDRQFNGGDSQFRPAGVSSDIATPNTTEEQSRAVAENGKLVNVE